MYKITMNIYLPIAGMTVNVFALIAIGAVGGFLSGMFGVGGGFMLTPLLAFIGVPPAVSVGTQASQMVGTSLAGSIAHWQRRHIDIRLGLAMMIGSFSGTTVGASLFQWLKQLGHINLAISLGYVVLLASIGSMMLIESGRHLWKMSRKQEFDAKNDIAKDHSAIKHLWGANNFLAMDFPTSKIKINILVPIGIGFMGGIFVAMLGIGGGFILVPAMIYILRMPPLLVNGTSLFQIVFTTAFATLLQVVLNNSVDILLAMAMLAGSVLGVPMGTRMASKLNPDVGRFLLALVIILVVTKMIYDLAVTPSQLFALETKFL